MEGIKPLEAGEVTKLIEKFSPFIKEIRKRLIITLTIFGVATIFGFIFYEKIIKFLVDILSLKGVNIVFTSPFQFINLAITCGVVVGLIVVFPVIILQIILFLRPALRRKELKTITRLLPFSIILFLIGFAFGVVIMKWQIEIFLNRALSLGIGNILDISGLFSVIFVTSALMGIGFQSPLILLILMRVGIIRYHQISSKRKWVYLGSFMFVMLLPPDTILADVILTLPFLILFELTLLLHRIMERERRKSKQLSHSS